MVILTVYTNLHQKCMEKTVVYVLVNPISLKIRYIGITKSSLNKRLGDHIFESRKNTVKTHKDNWILSLLKYNNKPIIRKIKEFNTRQEARDLELLLINKYKVKHQLTNYINEGKFKSTGKKSARTYLTKSVYLYSESGKYLKSFRSSEDCINYLNITKITFKKVLSRKKKFGLNIKYKFQLTRIKYDYVSPILPISNRSIIS